MSKAAEAFRTISEVADELDLHKHVLRFWEVKFPQIRPMKRGGGRRYYRPEDMELLRGIRHLLHNDGYTIKGVQKILREQGVDLVKSFGRQVRGAKGREARRQDAAPQTASASGTTQAPGRGRASGASPVERRRLIEGVIAELEACRRLLGGETRESRRARRPRAGR